MSLSLQFGTSALIRYSICECLFSHNRDILEFNVAAGLGQAGYHSAPLQANELL